MHTLILSSASPRRKELLAQIGLFPRILPSNEEELHTDPDPVSRVLSLAETKNRNVASQLAQKGELARDLFFLGADTIVVKDERILEKPASPEEASEMLHLLQSASHHVLTGVSIMRIKEDGMIPDPEEAGVRLFSVSTEVCIAPMTETEIRDYIATGEPLDKAGAYAIQGLFAKHVREIRGDYSNVVGLPLPSVYRNLKELGFYKE